MDKIFKFLPSYVGSKARWVEYLTPYKGSDMVELFSGSAILSSNLAKTSVLNDLDPYIFKIFSNYGELIVPDEFTEEDYYRLRGSVDWWKYIYCLQKMSFSGVFRHSKNGYNVPMKKGYIKSVSLKEDFAVSKKRFEELKPQVLNLSYADIPTALLEGRVVVLDPPYQNKQASYNANKFDYDKYWKFVKSLRGVARTIIIFDTAGNIKSNLGVDSLVTRNMRVNGKHPGDIEAVCILGENLCQK